MYHTTELANQPVTCRPHAARAPPVTDGRPKIKIDAGIDFVANVKFMGERSASREGLRHTWQSSMHVYYACSQIKKNKNSNRHYSAFVTET